MKYSTNTQTERSLGAILSSVIDVTIDQGLGGLAGLGEICVPRGGCENPAECYWLKGQCHLKNS
jgi:hypothetical protein